MHVTCLKVYNELTFMKLVFCSLFYFDVHTNKVGIKALQASQYGQQLTITFLRKRTNRVRKRQTENTDIVLLQITPSVLLLSF